jgi:DNA polymerase III subunit gamma/tau
MSSRTFYRKYRSGNFDELVGQEHIVQTLTNAIEGDRVSQAYIFSGPRGTGKTSSARIFSKAINTYKADGQFKDLTSELCNRISAGVCVDVIEIDAASNTGVDNIREINEKINFTPVEAHYKIYIIDEVHMLSIGAFNALLKTLEEPPERVIFILATTEPHKIPITIHSRCQHLQFRNLTLDEIKKQLKYISEKESLTIDDNALTLLSRNAQGCMRDGVSLLDQAYSFRGEKITYEDVLYILGATEESQIIALVKEIIKQDSQAILKQLQTFFDAGTNPTQLITDLIESTKSLLYIKLSCTEMLNAPPSTELKALANSVDQAFLERSLDTLAKTEMELRWFSKPQLLLQLRLIALSSNPSEQVVAKPASPAKAAVPVRNTPAVPTAPAPAPAVTPPAAPVYAPVTQKSAPPKAAMYPAATPEKVAPKAPVDSSNAQARWNETLLAIQRTHHALYAILKESRVELNGKSLTLKLKQAFKFFIEKLKEDKTKGLVLDAIKAHFGEGISFTVFDPSDSAPVPSAQQSTVTSSTTTSPIQQAGSSDPSVVPTNSEKSGVNINTIVNLFEGSVV